MFQKKNVLLILVVGFFACVFNGTNFAQETEDEEEIVPVDTTEAYIPANYQPVELVRELGRKMFLDAVAIAFSPGSGGSRVVYVADAVSRVISAFDLQGGLISSFGGQMRGDRAGVGLSAEEEAARLKEYNEANLDKFRGVSGIEVDSKGNIYVADNSSNVVKIFTSEWKFVLVVPLQVSLQKERPGLGAAGVAVNSRGDIYIADRENGRIQVNDLDGKYKYQITKFRDKSGKEMSLLSPADPRINSFDELYVIDPLVCRVYRFNVDGDYLGGFGYMGDGAGGFNGPIGLAIDKLGRVYVADIGFGTIQVFSREGKFLYALCDENGRRPKIPFVNGINVDSDGLIYVSVGGEGGSRIMVFKYLTKGK